MKRQTSQRPRACHGHEQGGGPLGCSPLSSPRRKLLPSSRPMAAAAARLPTTSLPSPPWRPLPTSRTEPAPFRSASAWKELTDELLAAMPSGVATPRTPIVLARLVGVDGLLDLPSPSPGVKEADSLLVPESMNKEVAEADSGARVPLAQNQRLGHLPSGGGVLEIADSGHESSHQGFISKPPIDGLS